MIAVGLSRYQCLVDALDGKTIDGVTFRFVKKEGLLVYFSHDASDEQTAAAIVKKTAKALPELRAMFVNVRVVKDGEM